jgi:hypothetical protein
MELIDRILLPVIAHNWAYPEIESHGLYSSACWQTNPKPQEKAHDKLWLAEAGMVTLFSSTNITTLTEIQL